MEIFFLAFERMIKDIHEENMKIIKDLFYKDILYIIKYYMQIYNIMKIKHNFNIIVHWKIII